MIGPQRFRVLALSFAAVTEAPHFEKASFRYRNKIFATLNAARMEATVKLVPVQQSIFSLIDPSMIFPVPNKWGHQGWTNINLSTIDEALLQEVLAEAYRSVGGEPE